MIELKTSDEIIKQVEDTRDNPFKKSTIFKQWVAIDEEVEKALKKHFRLCSIKDCFEKSTCIYCLKCEKHHKDD